VKGIIFNLLEDVVTAEHGVEQWEDVLDCAGLDGSYTAVGSYNDAEFLALVSALPGSASMSPGDRLRAFGRSAMGLLAQRYPVFFNGHTATRSFVLTLNQIIHPEVRKLYPGADVPVFDFDDDPGEPQTVIIGYRSARHLCQLAEGFVQGAADYFGEHVRLSQSHCMRHGEERCLIVCEFSPERAHGV